MISTFSQFLVEFGDRPFPWKITRDTEDAVIARFDPPVAQGEEPFHYEVLMVATKWPPSTGRPSIPRLPPLPIEWEFGFGLVRPRDTQHSTVGAMLRDDGYHYDTLVGDVNISLAVISTVASIFTQFIRMKRPARVYFSAKGDSRVRLYRRLANKVSTTIPGYSAQEEKPGFWAITRTPRATPTLT